MKQGKKKIKQEKKVPIVAKIPSAPKNKKKPTTQPTIVDSQMPFFFWGGCKIKNEKKKIPKVWVVAKSKTSSTRFRKK